MKKLITRITLLFAAVPLLAASPASATGLSYFSDFGSQPATNLFFTEYEGGVGTSGQACGTDACATFETAGNRDFMKITVNPSATPGFYQNVDATQVDINVPNPTNSGPYTATYGHPVTMEAKIKWSHNYDLYGLSDAQGTSGVVLWNSALDGPNGDVTLDFDQIGFGWNSVDFADGELAGFNAASYVDQVPVGFSRPSAPIDIHGWIKVKMVWSENASGVQSVAYYADGQYLGTQELPVNLEGMSLVTWNDNQEPYYCEEEGVCWSFPNPNQPQSFYVDYVKVTQE